jgi:hypothetical protein
MDYFELKAIEKKQMQKQNKTKTSLPSSYLPKMQDRFTGTRCPPTSIPPHTFLTGGTKVDLET